MFFYKEIDVNLYSLSFPLGNELTKQKKRLVLAESCTGGGLAAILTDLQGASAWFDRAYVVYNNEAKMEMLAVSKSTLETYGAVSAQTAKEMAQGALLSSHTDLSLSITGIAGPRGGSPEKPVGTVWFALAQRDQSCETREMQFDGGGRQAVRLKSIQFALQWLLEVVCKDHKKQFDEI